MWLSQWRAAWRASLPPGGLAPARAPGVGVVAGGGGGGGVLRGGLRAVVLVRGNTTTAMAAGLAAFYQRTLVGHVEAGLRTYDNGSPWPEEGHRRILGAIA